MALIITKDERVRRNAKSTVSDLYEKLLLSNYTLDDAAEWLGCSKTNVYKIFKSGGVKAWQYECIRIHLNEEGKKNT